MDVAHWTDWSPRGDDFRQVLEYDDGRATVAIECMPQRYWDRDEWQSLVGIWLDLPIHPSGLEALDLPEPNQLLLRYAALDWQRGPTTLTGLDARAQFATWGAQVTEYYQLIAEAVPHQHLPALLLPYVKIDIGEHARVGFHPVVPSEPEITEQLPPEVFGGKHSWDERSLVFAIGHVMRKLRIPSTSKVAVDAIIDRATDPVPRKRYRSLNALRKAWRAHGADDEGRGGVAFKEWRHIDEGFGWLAVDKPQRATEAFECAINSARSINVSSSIGLIGRAHARALIAAREPVVPLPRVRVVFPTKGAVGEQALPAAGKPPPQHTWVEAMAEGSARESARAFAYALELYRRVRLDGKDDAAILTAIARCELAVGHAEVATDYAQRAIAFDPRHVEAHAVASRAWFACDKADKALAAADAWIALRASDAAAHYARGRALMMLARYHDARDAFDRACALDPTMNEAMMLRREADRAMARIRDEVGTQPEIKIELPAHLEHLAALLSAGRAADVIQILDAPKYAADPEANLVRARCLAFDKRFDDAIAAFDRVIDLSPDRANVATLGKAYALLAADRPAEALQLFDTMSFDIAALEGRALALQALGRIDDAEAAMRQVTNTRA